MSVIHVLPILININEKKRSHTLIKRSGTVKNGRERSKTVRNGERSGTLNGMLRSYCTRKTGIFLMESLKRFTRNNVIVDNFFTAQALAKDKFRLS
jgi:hypothetical protein